MVNSRQVVFIRGDSVYYPSGAIVEAVVLRGLGYRLPPGMYARYDVVTDAAGAVTVSGTIQARSKHGCRHFRYTIDAESTAQKTILDWSTRILRERRDEITTKEGSHHV